MNPGAMSIMGHWVSNLFGLIIPAHSVEHDSVARRSYRAQTYPTSRRGRKISLYDSLCRSPLPSRLRIQAASQDVSCVWLVVARHSTHRMQVRRNTQQLASVLYPPATSTTSAYSSRDLVVSEKLPRKGIAVRAAGCDPQAYSVDSVLYFDTFPSLAQLVGHPSWSPSVALRHKADSAAERTLSCRDEKSTVLYFREMIVEKETGRDQMLLRSCSERLARHISSRSRLSRPYRVVYGCTAGNVCTQPDCLSVFFDGGATDDTCTSCIGSRIQLFRMPAPATI